MGLRLFLCSLVLVSVTQAEDLLPSWADTAPKQAILDFVAKVSNPNGKDFVPEQDRLAVMHVVERVGHRPVTPGVRHARHGGGVANPRLVVDVVGAPIGGELAEEIGLLVVVLS